MSRMLLISSNCVHLCNYYDLINNCFEDILVVTNGNENKINNTIFIRFSLKNPFYFIKSIIKIRKIINDYKPDIIHCHQINVVSLVTVIAKKISKLKNVPVVATAWGSDILVNPRECILHKIIISYTLNNINIITSDSLFLSYEIKNIFKKQNLNIKIANFGVEFLTNQQEPQKENIIYSNRLHKKMYNIDKIIIGFKNFLEKSKNNNWTLIIAADGPETQKYKKIVEELNLSSKIKFVGFLTKEVNIGYYKKSKIFISIPENDATSISLLESMYYGCIPIVSNLPANMEWIIDGLNGIINENPLSLDESIFRALYMNYDYCTEINRKIIKLKASKDVNRKLYIDIYEKLLGNSLCKK